MGRQLARWVLPTLLAVVAASATPAGLGGQATRGDFGAAPAAAQEMPALPPGVTISRRAITALEADPGTRTLSIFERVELRNENDTPFVPSLGAGQGPGALLRFSLPRNAFDLTLDDRLSAYDVIQVDRGFASLLPLPPGATDVNFSYRVPYAGQSYELGTNAALPTASMWVLVPGEFAATSSDLRLDRVADIGRQQYQVLVADNLAAGQRVTVSLAGLPFIPRPWWLDETVQRAAAVALAVAGVIAAWAYARVRGATVGRAARPARVPEPADA